MIEAGLILVIVLQSVLHFAERKKWYAAQHIDTDTKAPKRKKNTVPKHKQVLERWNSLT